MAESPRPALSTVLFAFAVAGVVLSPYATTWLRFRQALEVQAVLILGFTLLPIVGWLSARRPRLPLTSAPPPVKLGVVLYSTAVALGSLVAMIHGNEPRLIAGQALSIGLLPLGFTAAQTVAKTARQQVFARSLVGCTVLAAVIHFSYWTYRSLLDVPQVRLYLPNAVSVAGLALMALLVAGAAMVSPGEHHRPLVVVGAVVLSIYLVGTGTRSLWAATVLGIVAFFTIEFLVGPRTRSVRLVVAAVATLAVLGLGVILLATRIPRETVLPQESFHGPFWKAPQNGYIVVDAWDEPVTITLPPKPGVRRVRETISNTAILESQWLLLASAEALGSGAGGARVNFVFSPGSGESGHVASLPFTASGDWEAGAVLVYQVPEEAVLVRVDVVRDPADSAEWRLRRIRLEQYRTGLPKPLARQLIYLEHRLVGTLHGPLPGIQHRATSLDFRVRETAHLVQMFHDLSPPDKLFGRGLGARFDFQARGYNALGQRVLITKPNYIHNFYAFLLVKLGVIGTLLVLGAIGIWIGCVARGLSGDLENQIHSSAAYVAIWTAYLAWAVFCPELIDFRVSPIVGMLVGALGEPTGKPRCDEASRRSSLAGS